VLVVLGLLLVLVLLEAFGMKKFMPNVLDPKTGKYKHKEVGVLSQYPRVFQVALVIIAAVVFISAGGFGLLGIQLPTDFNVIGTVFIVGMILAVLWLISESKEED